MQELVLTPAGMNKSSFDNTFFLNDTSTIAIPYDVDGKPHGRAPMRHPILSTGLMWTTASDLARFNLTFTKALNSGHSLIDQPLAKQLSIPSSLQTAAWDLNSATATQTPKQGAITYFTREQATVPSAFQSSAWMEITGPCS